MPRRMLSAARLLLLAATMLIGSGTVAMAAAGAPYPIAAADRAGQCLKRVAFGLVEATTTGCLTSDGTGRWGPGDAVRINGLPLPVVPGTRLALYEPSAAAPGGRLETRQPTRFSIDGRGRVCVGGVACATGEVPVSTTGLAGCFSLADVPYWVLEKDGDWAWYASWRVHGVRRTVRAGLGQRWSPSRFDLMGAACDIGPYRTARGAIAAANGERRLVLPDEPAIALRVAGAGAPPKLVVTGPDGRRIASPRAPGDIDDDSHVLVEDPQQRVTHLVIERPEPGRWTIATQRGFSITGVQRAETVEPPTIVADVGVRRGRYVLAYAHAVTGGRSRSSSAATATARPR